MTEEDIIQRDIVNAVRLAYPKSFLFAVPNGGFRNKYTAIVLKMTGTVAGVADLIFLHNDKLIFVEVKTPKGVLSKTQKAFRLKITDMGYSYWIVRSAHEMLERIKEYNYAKF